MDYFSLLPNEIFHEIISYIPVGYRHHAVQVNKYWYENINDGIVNYARCFSDSQFHQRFEPAIIGRHNEIPTYYQLRGIIADGNISVFREIARRFLRGNNIIEAIGGLLSEIAYVLSRQQSIHEFDIMLIVLDECIAHVPIHEFVTKCIRDLCQLATTPPEIGDGGDRKYMRPSKWDGIKLSLAEVIAVLMSRVDGHNNEGDIVGMIRQLSPAGREVAVVISVILYMNARLNTKDYQFRQLFPFRPRGEWVELCAGMKKIHCRFLIENFMTLSDVRSAAWN